MARESRNQFRHEDVAQAPRGWRVRSITHPSGHVVRVAFPRGPRRKGAGRLVSILHPEGENPRCNRRKPNPLLDSIIGGLAAGTSVVLASEAVSRWKGRGNPPRKQKTREQVEKMQEKAVAFLNRIGQPDKAEEIGGMSLQEYAAKKKVSLANPRAKSKGKGQKAKGKNARRNQGNGAGNLYEDFHGRSAHEVLEMQDGIAQSGDYAALGDAGGLWLRPVKGDPEKWGKADIRFEPEDKVKLAASPESSQLYLIGGNQELPLDYLRSLGEDVTKDFIPLGTVYALSYATEKSFDGYRTSEYGHELGEETGECPTAFYDRRQKRIVLVGGAYSIAPPKKGLGASPGIVN